MTPIDRATAAVMTAMGDGPGSRDVLRAQAIARAVIAAIREPSEGMLGPAYGECHSPKDVPEHIWHVMIDAMLAERS